MTRSRSCPSADQSRWASSISLSDFEIQTALAAALQPVVEQDAGDLAALAGAGAVAEKPAAAEADGVFGVVGRGRDDVEGLVHRPRSGEMAAMGLAGIDHAFELGVGQHAVGDDIGGQARPIAWLGRRDRRHRRRLHQLGGVSLRAGNTDRLQSVSLIDRIGDVGRPRPASSRWSHRPAQPPPGRASWPGRSEGRGATRRGRAGGGTNRGPGDDRAWRAAAAAEQSSRSSQARSRHRARCRARPETPSDRAAGSLSMTVSRVSMVVPCLA